MSTSLPAGTGPADFFIPPRPAWAREDTHQRFWAAVGRAVEGAALPPSVWSADPDDVAQDEELRAGPGADEEDQEDEVPGA